VAAAAGQWDHVLAVEDLASPIAVCAATAEPSNQSSPVAFGEFERLGAQLPLPPATNCAHALWVVLQVLASVRPAMLGLALVSGSIARD
jgi:hypothetical protein